MSVLPIKVNFWMSVLPIKVIGYALNKQEFTDAVCRDMDGRWKRIPTHCACGEANSVDHSLICKLGGYTSMRYNSVRGDEAQIMRSVEMFRPSPHFCQSMKMILKEKSTLLTMQVWVSLREDCGIAVRKLSLGSHILPHSLILKSPQQRSTHNMKKRRIITTTEWLPLRVFIQPLVQVTTSGGIAPEWTRVSKRLAENIAEKRREPYASVMTKHEVIIVVDNMELWTMDYNFLSNRNQLNWPKMKCNRYIVNSIIIDNYFHN